MTRKVTQLLTLSAAIFMLATMCIVNVFALTEGDNHTRYGVQKIWNDNNNEASARPQSVTVELYADGEATGQTAVLNEGNNWAYTWENLDGGKTYHAVEIDLPQNYTTTSKQVAESKFVVTEHDRITKCNSLTISVPTSDCDAACTNFLVVSLTSSAKEFGKYKFVMWTEEELSDANKAALVEWIRSESVALFQKITVDTTVFLFDGSENPYSKFVSFEKDENQIVGTSFGSKSVWQQVLYGCGSTAPAYTELTGTYVPPVQTPESTEGTQDSSDAEMDDQAPETPDNTDVVPNETPANSNTADANNNSADESDDAADESDDSADESDDAADESDDTADESDDTADESDDSADESDNTADESDDTADESDDSADESDDSADESDESADESDDAADESDDTADESDNSADESDDTADESNDAADESDDTADESDDAADESDVAADESDESADESDESADESDDAADESDDAADESDDTVITNNKPAEIYVPVHTLGSIVVTKTTIGAETPADATFQLQNLSGDFWTNVGEAVAYSAFANGAYTFTELAEGTYRILESGAVIDGHTLVTTYSANVVLNKTTADNGDTSVNNGSISVTNRYTEISVPVHTQETIEETQDSSEADVDVQAPETTDSANVALNETTANSGDTSANIQEMPAMEEEITVPEETESEELVEISDEDVPMTDLPQTSDPLLLCAGFAMLSCIGLGVALKTRKNNG